MTPPSTPEQPRREPVEHKPVDQKPEETPFQEDNLNRAVEEHDRVQEETSELLSSLATDVREQLLEQGVDLPPMPERYAA